MSQINLKTSFSLNEISELVKEVIIGHSLLYLFFCIFTVNTSAPVRLAEDTHLEALAIFFLTAALLALATRNMPSSDVGFFSGLI